MDIALNALNAQQGLVLIHQINTSTIYLMGASFVLGSIFTLLLLLILDWVRHHNLSKDIEKID